MGRCDGLGRILRVMQRLAQHHQINALYIDGWMVQITKPEFQVL